MQIGRTIYYEISTGNVLADTCDKYDVVIETTIEQDFESYQALKDRVPSTVGFLKLGYGELASDFAICIGYRVNLTTLTLEFSYPDPNVPPSPPVYQKALSEEVSQLKSQNADLIFAMVTNNLM